jgi:subtilisin family serine protease
MTNDLGCVNDHYFVNGQQWNLNGVFGINYCAARSITTGNPNIIVAVFDQGIVRGHPDIVNIHSNSYDTETLTSPSQLYYVHPTGLNHGTPVAGIIGASSNNGIGIAGVAPNCRLMDISNKLNIDPLSREKRANGINWAWRNGASVINNSWSSSVAFSVIDEAIDSALQYGRGGRGTVVVFCTGNNSNPTVNYPAYVNSDIIAVGSTTSNGQRAGSSNYGDALDIVAPGELIRTTDVIDYRTEMGTSFAAPHVSAVAALILSVNPNLTQKQVADIIKSTARKVGPYTYSNTPGRPNGTWNNEMGHGLLDAGAAVAKAVCLRNIHGATISNFQSYTSGNCIVDVQNTTVTPTGTLNIRATERVNIGPGFNVQQGGSLTIEVP